MAGKEWRHAALRYLECKGVCLYFWIMKQRAQARTRGGLYGLLPINLLPPTGPYILNALQASKTASPARDQVFEYTKLGWAVCTEAMISTSSISWPLSWGHSMSIPLFGLPQNFLFLLFIPSSPLSNTSTTDYMSVCCKPHTYKKM